MSSIGPGDIVRVATDPPFTTLTGTPTDPSIVTVRWRDPAGIETVWVYGVDLQVVRESAGIYHTDIPVSQQGVYAYRFEGTGTLVAVAEGQFISDSDYADDALYAFLVQPDDYEAIRDLLGVTKLDVTDETIESVAFSQQAEEMIKRRISNWAAQRLVPADKLILRFAAVYGTAALIAAGYVRGGMIGLAFPETRWNPRDWPAIEAALWARYDYWLSIADNSDVVGEDNSLWFVSPLRVSGPTQRRVRLRNSLDPLVLPNLPWYRYPPLVPD